MDGDDAVRGGAGRRRRGGWLPWPALALLPAASPRSSRPRASIPPPLGHGIPVAVGLHRAGGVPRGVHKEKRERRRLRDRDRQGADGRVRPSHAPLFRPVVPARPTDAGAATDAGIRGVLEPVLEELSFVTPRRYRHVGVCGEPPLPDHAYTPAGKLVDRGRHRLRRAPAVRAGQGQGRAAAGGSSAMRDAGAKLAVEFREQRIVAGSHRRRARRRGPGCLGGSAAALRGRPRRRRLARPGSGGFPARAQPAPGAACLAQDDERWTKRTPGVATGSAVDQGGR